jgi:hypothetical protein
LGKYVLDFFLTNGLAMSRSRYAINIRLFLSVPKMKSYILIKWQANFDVPENVSKFHPSVIKPDLSFYLVNFRFDLLLSIEDAQNSFSRYERLFIFCHSKTDRHRTAGRGGAHCYAITGLVIAIAVAILAFTFPLLYDTILKYV